MAIKQKILSKIKYLVCHTAPESIIILYGSYARGDQRKDSDIDLLILVNKKKITWEEQKKIKYPLYELEFDTGKIISPLVITKWDWKTKYRITPLYANIKREGIEL